MIPPTITGPIFTIFAIIMIGLSFGWCAVWGIKEWKSVKQEEAKERRLYHVRVRELGNRRYYR